MAAVAPHRNPSCAESLGGRLSPWRFLAVIVLLGASSVANAYTVGCVTTAWKLIGANHKVCVDAFTDPAVPGVTCHVSQARTGGVAGTVGLAQDPSQFSLACRQTEPITRPAKLPKEETVFSEDASIHGIQISMDGKGCWRDNVLVERLWESIKYEEVYLKVYDSVSAAKASLGIYLNFYNTRRPHQSLDGKTPDTIYFAGLPQEKTAA